MIDFYHDEAYREVRDYPGLILATLGGSYAYGTNVATSDVDVRGIYLNTPGELIGVLPDKEEKTFGNTDTVLYSLKKAVKLLCNCNPNVIEILGVDDFFVLTDAGRELVNHQELFLSKKAINSFGGYAKSQLNRLVNKTGRTTAEITNMKVRSLDKVMSSFYDRYKGVLKGDFSVRRCDDDVALTMSFRDLPLEQIIGMNNELINVEKDYAKSRRNDHAAAHGKITKHMMHLIRLYMMGIDILEIHEVITRRTAEHDLLMAIRNGEFMEEDGITPNKEFEKLLSDYSWRFEEAAKYTTLPDQPDYNKINDLIMNINRKWVI